jgi:uncharacterized protein
MIKAIDRKAKYIFKATLFCVVFTVVLVAFSFAKGFVPGSYERIAHGIVGTAAALATTFLFLKFDRKRPSDINLNWKRSTILKFFAGALAGVAIMGSLVVGVVYFSNVGIAVNQKSSFSHFLLATLPLVPLACMEEVGFRAYPLEIL